MSAKSTKIRHIIDKIFCKKIAKEKLKRQKKTIKQHKTQNQAKKIERI